MWGNHHITTRRLRLFDLRFRLSKLVVEWAGTNVAPAGVEIPEMDDNTKVVSNPVLMIKAEEPPPCFQCDSVRTQLKLRE